MSSKYWDDFELRTKETVAGIKNNTEIPVRRVAVFITNRCNYKCKYCNVRFGTDIMDYDVFDNIVKKYGKTAIIHITGGEPSLVPWLYSYIEEHKDIRFHLNTNAYLEPPKNIKRLKISMDTQFENEFDELVQCDGAFKRTVANIKKHSPNVITSLTCVLSKKTYENAPAFMKFCRQEFPDLYAVFFSVYKGIESDFVMNEEDIDTFFNDVRPKLEAEMDKESLELFKETIDEKFRIMKGERFPENKVGDTCYLSISERVFDFRGNEYKCSHLYRDSVYNTDSRVYAECKYGCNRRLAQFNTIVKEKLGEQ